MVDPVCPSSSPRRCRPCDAKSSSHLGPLCDALAHLPATRVRSAPGFPSLGGSAAPLRRLPARAEPVHRGASLGRTSALRTSSTTQYSHRRRVAGRWARYGAPHPEVRTASWTAWARPGSLQRAGSASDIQPGPLRPRRWRAGRGSKARSAMVRRKAPPPRRASAAGAPRIRPGLRRVRRRGKAQAAWCARGRRHHHGGRAGVRPRPERSRSAEVRLLTAPGCVIRCPRRSVS